MSVTATEWDGQVSAKFTTWKAHIAGPNPKQDGFHPLFNVNQRTHFAEQRSKEFEWISSSKLVPDALNERIDRA